MFKRKLKEELKQSMLARNALKTSVLRLLLSAINYFEIQKGGAGYEATDEDVLSVIQKEAKQRRDSIEEYKKAARQELVDKETKELEMLQAYLPQQMSEDEIKSLVKETIIQTGVKTITEMGKVMGALMPKVKDKADGAIVSRIVRESLS
jgi:hypothetical protein